MKYSKKLKYEMTHRKPINYKRILKKLCKVTGITILYLIAIGVFILRIFI